MSENGTNRTEPQTPDGVDAQLVLVRSLASESRTQAGRLRAVQIPQHVGMAAAASSLAVDLPRALVAQLQGELSSGALGQRWEAALKRLSGADGERAPEAALAAVASLLIELAQRTGRYLAGRADEWTQDACRLDGQATTLEEQVRRLERAEEGIVRSHAEGQATSARQERRRAEREDGAGPGHGGGDDGNHA